jgi:hypothetical protein
MNDDAITLYPEKKGVVNEENVTLPAARPLVKDNRTLCTFQSNL